VSAIPANEKKEQSALIAHGLMDTNNDFDICATPVMVGIYINGHALAIMAQNGRLDACSN
jgi:hypothetical protein